MFGYADEETEHVNMDHVFQLEKYMSLLTKSLEECSRIVLETWNGLLCELGITYIMEDLL